MPRSASLHPTDGELEILRILWTHRNCTLRTICESVRRKRDAATTTVATMLRVMLNKGIVRRKLSSSGQQWSAAISQKSVANTMVAKLIADLFDDSASQLLAYLVGSGQLSSEQLNELRTMIDTITPCPATSE